MGEIIRAFIFCEIREVGHLSLLVSPSAMYRNAGI